MRADMDVPAVESPVLPTPETPPLAACPSGWAAFAVASRFAAPPADQAGLTSLPEHWVPTQLVLQMARSEKARERTCLQPTECGLARSLIRS